MRTLAEIDEDLKALFKERNEVLATQVRPFKEVYTVFNHDLERVEMFAYSRFSPIRRFMLISSVLRSGNLLIRLLLM